MTLRNTTPHDTTVHDVTPHDTTTAPHDDEDDT